MLPLHRWVFSRFLHSFTPSLKLGAPRTCSNGLTIGPVEAPPTAVDSINGPTKCKACYALATSMWNALQDWTHKNVDVPSPTDLVALGRELCEYEVPIRVLKDHEVFMGHIQDGDFYLLSAARDHPARPAEIDVVKAACLSLVSDALSDNDTSTTDLSAPMYAAAAGQIQYLELLLSYGASPQPAATHSPLAAQRACFNKHPQCEYWAAQGECVSNPAGMVGSPQTGWCRSACSACERPKSSPPTGVPEENYGYLGFISRALLDKLVESGCSSQCRGGSGIAVLAAQAAASGGGGAGEGKAHDEL